MYQSRAVTPTTSVATKSYCVPTVWSRLTLASPLPPRVRPSLVALMNRCSTSERYELFRSRIPSRAAVTRRWLNTELFESWPWIPAPEGHWNSSRRTVVTAAATGGPPHWYIR